MTNRAPPLSPPCFSGSAAYTKLKSKTLHLAEAELQTAFFQSHFLRKLHKFVLAESRLYKNEQISVTYRKKSFSILHPVLNFSSGLVANL